MAIIPSHSAWKMCSNFPGIKLVETIWMFGKKIDNLSSGAQVLKKKLVNSHSCQGENDKK